MAKQQIRVMIQVKSSSALAATAFGARSTPQMSFAKVPGVEIDSGFSPVPVPDPQTAGARGAIALLKPVTL